MSQDPTSAIGPGGGTGPHEKETRVPEATLRPPRGSGAAGAAQFDPTPTRIGPYRIVREIGRGGMGSVLLALRDDDRFAKTVAIKLIKRGMDTADILHRFSVERQVLSALNHPNIARVFDAGAAPDGRPYFVMEHVDGGMAITEYCDSNQLSTAERLRLFKKVCAAVHTAHQNLIVHRDLKPGNILVDKHGEPKLLDFGIAKLLNADLLGTPMVTGPELRLMTPEYASPEQVQGQPISTASDVYSLGVLLYELLTGHAPYRFKTRLQEEIIRIVCEVEPEKPSTAVSRVEEVTTPEGGTRTLKPEDVARVREAAGRGGPHRLRRRLTGDIDNIVLMAMRKVPRRRYASAEQFAEDIQRHLDGMPVIARQDTFIYRTGKFIGRNRAGVAAAAVIALLLLGGIAGTTWQRMEAEKARKVAEDAESALNNLATAYVRELPREVRKLEGATPAKALLAKTAAVGLKRFETEAGANPKLRALLAEGLLGLGDVQGGAGSGNEGVSDDAVKSYERAIAILRDLLKERPEDVPLRRQLAGGMVKLAQVLLQGTKLDKAAVISQEAINTARDALKTDAKDRGLRKALAAALAVRAAGMIAEGKKDEAPKLIDESFDIRKKLADEQPDDWDVQRDLSVGYLRLGKKAEAAGDSDGATKDYSTALAIRERIAAAEKESARAKRDVLTASENVSRVLANTPGQEEKTLQQRRTQARLYEELATNDPTNLRARNDLVRSLGHLVDALMTASKEKEAEPIASRAMSMALDALRAEPASGPKQYEAAKAQERMGDLVRPTNAAEAARLYGEAVRLLEPLAAKMETVKPDLARVRASLGEVTDKDKR